MRNLHSHRTLGITASMLTVALLVPAAVLAAGPRDGTCDPIGTGPNRPAAGAPGQMNGQGAGRAQMNGQGAGRAQMDRSRRSAGGQAAGQAAARRGPGQGVRQPASGVLTADQKVDLASMAAEEKLAHDLYVTLGASLGGTELPRIAASETNHLAAIRMLLAKYGVADPTLNTPVGAFVDPAFQLLYDQLLAQGSVSLAAAYDVGVIVENDDLGRLADAKAGVTAQDVLKVYTNLTTASTRHLAIFQAL